MIQNHKYDFVSTGREDPPETFLLPREVAKSWFRCVVLHYGLLINSPPVRAHVLIFAVERGLRAEWNAQWVVAPHVEDARTVFPDVNTRWILEEEWDQNAFTQLTRFLMSDVYLGSLHLPQDDIIDICCPICRQLLSRQYILTEYRGLSMERDLLHRDLPLGCELELGWLARNGKRPLSRFLLAIQARFIVVGSMEVRFLCIESLTCVG